MSDDILKNLQELQVEQQIDVDSDPDMSIFRTEKKKKKKKKLFSDIDKILDNEDDTGDDDMALAMDFKSKDKDKDDVDGYLFDTKGKGNKKLKNLENKFKSEFASLQKLAKENENLSKSIKSILEPIFTSKARIPYKTLVDLVTAYNVTNNNRMQNIKETANLKKTIYDLKLKMEAKDKTTDTIAPDQFGAQLFDQLFKSGRKDVIDHANEYQPDLDEYTSQFSRPVDEAIEERLSSEANDAGSSFRSDEGSVMIKYESLQPELYIRKSFSTGDMDVVAVGNDGVVIDDYPVPDIERLGKLTFNNETNTCSDQTGRIFKVMDVK